MCQKFLQLCAAETIDFIAKLAGYLTIFLFFRHLAKFGPAHADERALYFFTAARTAVADFTGLQKIYLKAIEHARMMSSRLMPYRA